MLYHKTIRDCGSIFSERNYLPGQVATEIPSSVTYTLPVTVDIPTRLVFHPQELTEVCLWMNKSQKGGSEERVKVLGHPIT
jgi:hypothetical protein